MPKRDALTSMDLRRIGSDENVLLAHTHNIFGLAIILGQNYTQTGGACYLAYAERPFGPKTPIRDIPINVIEGTHQAVLSAIGSALIYLWGEDKLHTYVMGASITVPPLKNVHTAPRRGLKLNEMDKDLQKIVLAGQYIPIAIVLQGRLPH